MATKKNSNAIFSQESADRIFARRAEEAENLRANDPVLRRIRMALKDPDGWERLRVEYKGTANTSGNEEARSRTFVYSLQSIAREANEGLHVETVKERAKLKKDFVNYLHKLILRARDVTPLCWIELAGHDIDTALELKEIVAALENVNNKISDRRLPKTRSIYADVTLHVLIVFGARSLPIPDTAGSFLERCLWAVFSEMDRQPSWNSVRMLIRNARKQLRKDCAKANSG